MLSSAAWLQPVVACEEFQDVPLPMRSEWPTCAEPVALLVQLLQVWSALSVSARPSVLRAGEHVVQVRRRVADAADDLALLGERGLLEQIAAALRLNQRVAVQLATGLSRCGAPFELYQGRVPMRSRALTAGWPGRACVLR